MDLCSNGMFQGLLKVSCFLKPKTSAITFHQVYLFFVASIIKNRHKKSQKTLKRCSEAFEILSFAGVMLGKWLMFSG